MTPPHSGQEGCSRGKLEVLKALGENVVFILERHSIVKRWPGRRGIKRHGEREGLERFSSKYFGACFFSNDGSGSIRQTYSSKLRVIAFIWTVTHLSALIQQRFSDHSY